MARRVQITLEDDIDGGKADDTIKFGLDGTEYEIDLSRKNAKSLRDALAPYIDAGRRQPARRTSNRGSASNRGEANRIREWAAANGFEVSSRGRVPGKVREAYHNANG
ncbi:histone-like nucleoid-structuring protein Lsr2 [Propionibacteriaceae bacterium Y2011]|uniref:histone-like nucleoid-structuring protein Lsr2 n=1 Tax=Microlunatus sp. Y2014 TaxID=3418488 RepID=UPI003B4BC91A